MKNSWFTVKQINENIWGVGEFKHFEEVISYLIIGQKKALLFDTGLGIKNIKEEILKITNLPIVVINSHNHFDHVGGNKLFNKILNPSKQRIIELNPFSFEIIHTPGHSPDSICLYEKERSWLFSGDTLYPAPIYLHLKESSLVDYKKSIKKLLKLKISRIFPAHNYFSFSVINIKKIFKAVINKRRFPSLIKIDRYTSLLLKK